MNSRRLVKVVAAAAMLAVMVFQAGIISASPTTWVVDDDGVDCPDAAYTTIQAAVTAASPGDTIAVCTGVYAGALMDKQVHLEARGNVVVNDGPNTHPFLRAGFLFPGGGSGNGTTIKGFRFEGTPQSDYVDDGHLDLPIFSRGADNVTVAQNVMVNSLQAITNWHGDGWTIQHNTIEGLWVLCGGGIGILIGSFDSYGASNNLIAYNTIEADVSPDCDYYSTSGITIYSDTRWGRSGGPITDNRVLHNRSQVTGWWGDTPAGDGFEITDGGLLDTYPFTGDGNADVTGNTIAFNDFRGSSIEMLFLPDPDASYYNTVSRNLGDNRGHGPIPAAELFK